MSDQKEELPVVHMACRRTKSVKLGEVAQSSADRMDQHCDSKTAYKLEKRSPGVASYRCTKCGNVWNVPVGGQFQGI